MSLSRLLPPSAGCTVTPNVTVTTAPTARFPVQINTDPDRTRLPTEAAEPVFNVASSRVAVRSSLNVAPVYAVAPVLVATMVKPTTAPGVEVGVEAVSTIVRPGTSTLTAALQRVSVLPAAQLLPGVEDSTALVMCLSPGSGSFTVTA